jgi:hypothetical protein
VNKIPPMMLAKAAGMISNRSLVKNRNSNGPSCGMTQSPSGAPVGARIFQTAD